MPEKEPNLNDKDKTEEVSFDPDATDEFVPLIEDPADILKRGRKERKRYFSKEKRLEIEEETKKLIIENAKRREEIDKAKENKK